MTTDLQTIGILPNVIGMMDGPGRKSEDFLFKRG